MKKTGLTYGITILIVSMIALNIGLNFALGADYRTLIVDGSTTVFPIVSSASDYYMDSNKDDEITVTGSGSGTGIASLIAGTADIAMASREMKYSEKIDLPNWNEITIAGDGIALIVNPSNTITQLTMVEIMGIYNGTYSNWNELGGADLEMVVINRESTSGTRGFFYDHIMNQTDFRVDAQIVEKNSNGAIATEVSNTPAAIGYVGLGYITEDVKPLKVNNHLGDFIEPTVQNVIDEIYPISRSLYLYTDGTPAGLAKDFIDYLLSPTGQAIVEDESFVPIDEVGVLPTLGEDTSTIGGFPLWIVLTLSPVFYTLIIYRIKQKR